MNFQSIILKKGERFPSLVSMRPGAPFPWGCNYRLGNSRCPGRRQSETGHLEGAGEGRPQGRHRKGTTLPGTGVPLRENLVG